MPITILNEVEICLDVNHELMDDETLTLWLVSYGGESASELLDRWTTFLDTLDASLQLAGGTIESREDPLYERQLALFSDSTS